MDKNGLDEEKDFLRLLRLKMVWLQFQPVLFLRDL